jgi:hypothetical protein
MTALLIQRMVEAFSNELRSVPFTTLRAGDAMDIHDEPPAYDSAIDVVTDSYLERHYAGLSYLDAPSWRHYLPVYAQYALRNRSQSHLAIDAFLSSLRPPDKERPRLGSLTTRQEALMRECLEALAFSEGSAYQSEACQVLEEWWIPNALYRQLPPDSGSERQS